MPAPQNDVRFALAVERSSMRTFPVDDLILKHAIDSDIDRFQENAVFPGELIVVLHESEDGQWFLVQKYNYLAWVKKNAVAIGARLEVLAYSDEADEILVMIGKRVRMVHNPHDERLSGGVLDMGLMLPLTRTDKVLELIDGRNPAMSFVVRMPVK